MDAENDRFLYVIGFDNSLVKVGQTRDMRSRYKHHQYWGRRHGLTVVDVDCGLRHGTAIPDELKLIRFCKARWAPLAGHREYFVNADFDEVDTYFRHLDQLAYAARHGRQPRTT